MQSMVMGQGDYFSLGDTKGALLQTGVPVLRGAPLLSGKAPRGHYYRVEDTNTEWEHYC